MCCLSVGNVEKARRIVVCLSLVFVSVFITAGCTGGAVVDGEDGSQLEADLEFWSWPDDRNHTTSWPESPSPPEYELTSEPNPTFDGNWGISQYFSDSPDGNCEDIDAIEQGTLSANSWHRIEVDKPGYERGVFYRYHEGYTNDECSVWDCEEGETIDDVPCHTFEDFRIQEQEGEHDRLPDIMVDPRAFTDGASRDLDIHYQCAKVPGSNEVELVGLRAPLATANVGNGYFNLRYDTDTDEGLLQRIETYENIPSSYRMVELDEVGVHHQTGPNHEHIHVDNWAQLRLVESTSACDRHPNHRDESCDVVESHKLGFCIADMYKVDESLDDPWRKPGDGNRAWDFQYRNSIWCVGDKINMGLGTGYSDVYGKHFEGQLIPLGEIGDTVAEDSYYLEGVWDPEGQFEFQRDDTNTAARVGIDIPAFDNQSDVSEHCVDGDHPIIGRDLPGVVDCRGFENMSYDADDASYCRDFLRCEVDSDCPDWLECREVSQHGVDMNTFCVDP